VDRVLENKEFSVGDSVPSPGISWRSRCLELGLVINDNNMGSSLIDNVSQYWYISLQL
jgi:hypothetical protein